MTAPHRPSSPWRRAVAYELARAQSLKSTWLLLVLASSLGLVALVDGSVYTHTAMGRSDYLAFGAVTAPVASVALLCAVFGAMSGGHEFRHGTAATSLVLFPSRHDLLLGKVNGSALFAAAAAVSAMTVGLVALPLAGMGAVNATVLDDPAALAGVALRGVLVCVGYATLGLACAVIGGSVVAGVAFPFVASALVEPILVIGLGRSGLLRYAYPFTEARAGLSTGEAPLPFGGDVMRSSPWLSLVAFLVFCTVVAVLAALRFKRTNVN